MPARSGATSDAGGGRRIVWAVCASVFFSVLNASIVNVVLPTIGQDLGVEPGRLGWVIIAYLLVYAVAIPIYGRLADKYGARRFFLIGQGVFAIGSLLCALAPSYPLLLVARVVQAGGGAAIPGLGVALIGRATAPQERGAALGLLSTAVGVASAIGPTLGGVVADLLGWHFIFAIGALAGLLVPLNWAVLPRHEGRGGERLDVWGGIFLGLTISGGLLAATEGARAGWGAPPVLWAAAVSLAGLIALVIRQWTATSPFIPRELLENRRYLGLGLTSFVAMTAFVGPLIGLPLLLTTVNNLPPSGVGLVLLPSAVLNAALGVVVGRLVDRFGAQIPVRAGLVVMLLALVGLSAAIGSPVWLVAALMGLLGAGVAFVSTPLSASVSLLVRPERLSSAQSISTMLFFLGGSFGTTLVTAVLALRREATDGLNPLHGGSIGVGFSDAFLLLTVPVLVALALSAAVPGAPAADAKPGPAGPGRALWRAVAYLCGYRRDTLGALAALLLVSAANLLLPQAIRLAIDEGIAVGRPEMLAVAVGGLLLVALVRGVFTFAQGYLAERASQGVAYDLRDALFSRIERLSFSYYDRVETGQLVTRLTNDVEQIRGFVGAGVVQLAAAVIMLLGSAGLLFALNWRLAIVALALILPIAVLLVRFVRQIAPLFGQVQQTLGRLNTILQEDLTGVRVIRTFAREDHETERYRAQNDDLLGKNLQTVRAVSNNFPFVFLFANLGTAAVVWYGGLEAIGGRLSIGELIAFNSYLTFLLFPILTVGVLAAGISRAGASAQRVFELLDQPLEIVDRPGARPLATIRGRVQYCDVRFRYLGSEREVLRGVSFAVEPGQTVAILGTTGSGKSTLVNLLPRFYDVADGCVLIDGQDVRDVTLASLRGQIGIVLQQALLFSGPVRDNIAYGRPEATDEEVVAAARAAQADEFIRALPQGYDTVVGERGVGLSGGQRQRIAIARALLIDPCLLILDDSTSAVDAETEAQIQEALDTLMRDARRTAFVIAQRISTVRDADLILVLDDGRVVAQGTHDELLRESALYNEILGSQMEDLTRVGIQGPHDNAHPPSPRGGERGRGVRSPLGVSS